jgi:hypothetical protein
LRYCSFKACSKAGVPPNFAAPLQSSRVSSGTGRSAHQWPRSHLLQQARALRLNSGCRLGTPVPRGGSLLSAAPPRWPMSTDPMPFCSLFWPPVESGQLGMGMHRSPPGRISSLRPAGHRHPGGSASRPTHGAGSDDVPRRCATCLSKTRPARLPRVPLPLALALARLAARERLHLHSFPMYSFLRQGNGRPLAGSFGSHAKFLPPPKKRGARERLAVVPAGGGPRKPEAWSTFQMTLWPSGSGVGLRSRLGLPAWARIPQVSLPLGGARRGDER